MSKTDMAKILGVSLQRYCMIEKAGVVPNKHIKTISELFGIADVVMTFDADLIKKFIIQNSIKQADFADTLGMPLSELKNYFRTKKNFYNYANKIRDNYGHFPIKRYTLSHSMIFEYLNGKTIVIVMYPDYQDDIIKQLDTTGEIIFLSEKESIEFTNNLYVFPNSYHSLQAQ